MFVSDKKRAAGFGGSEPFNRIKKDLIKEVSSLELLACCSAHATAYSSSASTQKMQRPLQAHMQKVLATECTAVLVTDAGGCSGAKRSGAGSWA